MGNQQSNNQQSDDSDGSEEQSDNVNRMIQYLIARLGYNKVIAN